MAALKKDPAYDGKGQSITIIVRADEAYKNTIKSEAAGRGYKLGEYSRKLLEIARKAVAANPDLLKEV